MPYLGSAAIISFFIKDAATNLPVAGDTPTMSILGDTTSAGASGTVTEVGIGLYYIDISAVENQFQEMTLFGTPSTAGAVIEPVRWSNDSSGDAFTLSENLASIISGLIVSSGTATAGGASTITLVTALGADNRGVGCVIAIASGTGAKQTRVISGYVNSTKVATVDRPWGTNPDNTSVYYIVAASQAALSGSTLKVGGVVLTDTVTTYAGNTPQTGDSFARLGAPTGASVSVDVAAVKTDTGNLVSRVTSTLFSGITSLAQWLGQIAGSQTPNSTAQTELRATGAGSGTFDPTTDSLEAHKDYHYAGAGLTAGQAHQYAAAAAAAKISGMDVNAPVIRNVADTRNLISGTATADGNRTAVSLNPE